jgi:glycosyltransferase involved in cell wall biosynthesis
MRGRILVVDHRTPTPDQDSGSASAFSYLRILSGSGFGVTFAPADLADAGPYTRALHDLGVETLAAPAWTSLDAVIEHFAPRSDVLLLYRAPVASRLFDLARRSAPSARILFHPVDLHFLRTQRQAVLSGDPAHAAAAEAMRRVELDLIGRADATIVVSTQEQSMLRELVPAAVVHRIPILRETPSPPPWWHSLFRRPSRRGPGELDGRRDALFIGGFEHAPNVDAVRWFAGEVWPLLRAKGFAERFVVVGSKTPAEITALACDDIEVRGHVADLVPLFARCRLSVAPLRFGGGIKGKIVTSLSHGVPVVATSIAAEGMELRHETDVLVADTPGDLADQIVRLRHDADLWRRLSHNGYRTFQEKFSLRAGADSVLAVFDRLVRG